MYSHKAIRKTHGTKDHQVHQERNDDHEAIEAYKLVVLLESIADQVCFDRTNEVYVENSVDNQVKHLLDTVVYLVDVNIPITCKRVV
jgi:hypothetical protein